MCSPYSLDLRERGIGFVKQDGSLQGAAGCLAISPSCATKLAERWERTGSAPPNERWGKRRQAGALPGLPACAGQGETRHHDAGTGRGLEKAGPASTRFLRACHDFQTQQFSGKKTLVASEQSRPDVAQRRDGWFRLRQPRTRIEPHHLLFIDGETAAAGERYHNEAAPSARAGTARQTLQDRCPFGHGHTQTFVAALRRYGLTAPWVLDGPMNRHAFGTDVETQLAPTLSTGDVELIFAQRAAGDADHPGLRRLAALFSRSQPHRDGLRQAEGALAEARRPNDQRTLAGYRQYLRTLQSNRVLELPSSRRICSRLHMMNRCSIVGFFSAHPLVPEARSRKVHSRLRSGRSGSCDPGLRTNARTIA